MALQAGQVAQVALALEQHSMPQADFAEALLAAFAAGEQQRRCAEREGRQGVATASGITFGQRYIEDTNPHMT